MSDLQESTEKCGLHKAFNKFNPKREERFGLKTGGNRPVGWSKNAATARDKRQLILHRMDEIVK